MRASRRLLRCVHQTTRSTHSFHSQSSPLLSYRISASTYPNLHTAFSRSFCTNKTDDAEFTETTTMTDEPDKTTVEADEKVVMNETVETAQLSSHTFQAETKQLLNIVSNSLYTDKEVFLRELLSNASDAMEKVRYNINKDSSTIRDSELPLEIQVFTDKEKGQIVIQDTGIGMNEQELIDNIGTIARSGSKAFVRSLADAPSSSESGSTPGTGQHIIGQFGVGFYSVFMVSDNVQVFSLSASQRNKDAFYWQSDGTGSFQLAKADGVQRGTKIVINLKPEMVEEFADKHRVEGIIKKYSSYLEYPIKLNGSLISSSGAIWAKQPSSVKESEYKEFYQLISNRYDDPMYTYHTHFDSAKFSAQVLLYVPPTHEEKFGAGRMKPGLNIYCKKVMVKRNAPEIVPDWLRFVKGAVDSENIPIHISRENMQDSALIKQLQESIMMKVVDYLKRQSKKYPDKYLKWWNEFGGFIKEGVCTDYANRSRIANLLRFETSQTPEKEKKSLEQYIESMPASTSASESKAEGEVEQEEEIYYVVAPNRAAALASPYMEQFIDHNREVLLCYAQIDEFCLKNLGSFQGKKLVGIESSAAVLDKSAESGDTLSEDNARRLAKWLKKKFPKFLDKVEPTARLKKHPSVLVDHQSAAIRSYLNALGEEVKTPPQRMQLNPQHKIVKGLYGLVQDGKEKEAMLVARQMVNNAFVAAGILDDARDMLQDMNAVMELALGFEVEGDSAPQVGKDGGDEDRPNVKPKGMDYEQEIVDKMNKEIEDAGGLSEERKKKMLELEGAGDYEDDAEVVAEQKKKTDKFETNQ